MKRSFICQMICFAIFTTIGLGCGGGKKEQLVSVSGSVTLDDAPLEGATVAFIPAKSKQTQPSWGYSDAAGKYQLKTADGGKGICLGEYRIVVSKLVQQDGTPIPRGSQTGGADALELVPSPHCDPRQTKNIAVVTKNGEVFDVSIQSGGKNKGKEKSKSKSL